MARYNMNNLTKQLEDKKKENYERADSCLWQEIDKDVEEMLNSFFKKWCGNMSAHLSDNDGNDGQRLKNFIMMYKNKAEIAILEQAIAEMQKQRQEILDEIRQRKKVYRQRKKVYQTETTECERTWDAWFELRQIELFIEQLNQPKTEDDGSSAFYADGEKENLKQR